MAVSVVETGCQPKVSLVTVFWVRAAPKHRYLQAFGSPVFRNTIIYATFAFSYWCGCKCRRNGLPAKSIAIYRFLGQGCPKTSLFTSFWEASAPKHHIIYAALALSYWSTCKPRRNRLPGKSIAIYSPYHSIRVPHSTLRPSPSLLLPSSSSSASHHEQQQH